MPLKPIPVISGLPGEPGREIREAINGLVNEINLLGQAEPADLDIVDVRLLDTESVSELVLCDPETGPEFAESIDGRAIRARMPQDWP